MHTEVKAMLASAGAYTIFGLSFLFSKLALDHAAPAILLFARFGMTLILLSLMLLLKLGKLHLRGKRLGPLLMIGLFQPVIYFICENYGLMYTTSSFTGVIGSISPVIAIVLGAVILKEKPAPLQWLCAGVSILGVLIISLMGAGSGTNTLAGCLCLVCAYAAGALYSIFARRYSSEFTPFEVTFSMAVLGVIAFGAMSLIQYGAEAVSLLGAALSEPGFLGGVMYLSALSSVAAFLLINYSLKRLPVARASIFGNISTVVSVLAGVLIMRDPFGPIHLLATVLILLGVWGVNRFQRRTYSE